MKRSNLLFAIPCLTVATVAPVISSCGDNKTEAEKIADAIFGPLDLKWKHIDSFEGELKKLSQEELNNELVYDLFALNDYFAPNASIKEIKDLYKDGTIELQTKITKKSLAFDKHDVLHATFLGYVSFVYTKDYDSGDIHYKANDYMMLTFDMLNLEVVIDSDSCSLIYEDSATACIGIAKRRCEGGTEEHMHPIYCVDVSEQEDLTIPTNSKNWKTV